MTAYTTDEIRAYSQSFARRMTAGDESAYPEFCLFLAALDKVATHVSIPIPNLQSADIAPNC